MAAIAEHIEIIAHQRGPIRDYLWSLPPDAKLYPDRPCGCILHNLLEKQYPDRTIIVSYDSVDIIDGQEYAVASIEGTLWGRLQRAWCNRHDGVDDGNNDYIYPATALAVLEATN